MVHVCKSMNLVLDGPPNVMFVARAAVEIGTRLGHIQLEVTQLQKTTTF